MAEPVSDSDPVADVTERVEPHQPRGSRLISATMLMASGTALSRLLGFAKASLIVAALGAGTRQADMFGTAQVIPQAIYMLLAGGVLNTVFVPQIVRAMETHKDGGQSYTNRLITLGMSAIGLITIGATVLAPVIIGDIYLSSKWRAPELAAQYNSVIMLSYLCLPQIFFYGLHVMVGQVLNARGKFGPMMWSPIGNNIVAIASILLFMVVWHGRTDTGAPFSTPQILVLGLGTTLGIATQGILLLPFLHGIGFRFRPQFDFRNSGLGRAGQVAKWTVGYMIVTQLGLVVITKLANGATAGGHGAGWTVYQNSNLIFMLPHSLITVSLVTAMLPSISRSVVAGDLAAASREVTQTMRLTIAALLPSAVAFLVLGFPIAQVLFGHGAGAEQWRPIGWTLMAFALGLVPFTLQHVCLRAFFALENTRITFFVQIGIVAVNVATALVLVLVFTTPLWVAPALGLAYAMSYLVGLGASLRQLRKHLPDLDIGELGRHCLRVLIAVLPAGVAGYLITLGFSRWSMSTLPRLLALVVAGMVAVPAYVALARLLRIAEINQILDLVGRRLGRGGVAASPSGEPELTPSGDSLPASESESGNISFESAADTPPSDAATADTSDEASATRLEHQHQDFPTGPPEMTGHRPDAGSPGCTSAGDPSTPVDDPTTPDSGDETPSGSAPQQERRDDDGAAGEDEDTQAYDFFELIGPDDPEAGADPKDITDTGSSDDSPEEQRLPAGTVLGDRYRLEELLAAAETSITWRAFDQVLSRSVLIHLLPAGDGRSSALLAAGRSAAGATDSRFLRILDAVEQDGTEADGRPIGSYVVSEYAVGQTLRTVLSVAALTGLEAAWVIREVADAMAGVHQQGLHHGLLTPDTVMITPSGNIKIGGLLIEAALAATGEAAGPTRATGDDPEGAQRADIAGIGKLLYACLVARWPGGPAFGLTAAPTANANPEGTAHHWLTPRQVRHGVSPTLDRICDQLLNPVPRQQSNPITNAAGLVGELDRVLGSADATSDLERRLRHPQPALAGEGPEPPPSAGTTTPALSTDEPEPVTVAIPSTPSDSWPTSSGRAGSQPAPDAQPAGHDTRIPAPGHPAAAAATDRRRHRRCIPVLIVTAVIVAVIVVLLVRVFGGGSPIGSSSSSSGSSTGSSRSKTVKIVGGKDFDPQGDKSEKPKEVKYALDGNPKTQWHTLAYYGSPKFGNLKKGLGLVLDLGEPHQVRQVTVGLVGHGTSLQARVPKGNAAKISSAPMKRAKAWRPVARQQKAGKKTTLTFDKPVKTRFVLVYLTSLPKEGGHYRGGISQLTVRS